MVYVRFLCDTSKTSPTYQRGPLRHRASTVSPTANLSSPEPSPSSELSSSSSELLSSTAPEPSSLMAASSTASASPSSCTMKSSMSLSSSLLSSPSPDCSSSPSEALPMSSSSSLSISSSCWTVMMLRFEASNAARNSSLALPSASAFSKNSTNRGISSSLDPMINPRMLVTLPLWPAKNARRSSSSCLLPVNLARYALMSSSVISTVLYFSYASQKLLVSSLPTDPVRS
mmetsp:Transcript_26410/g.74736  ORF Transcript_26410/g.74736 Transcript_26410/m.74736 type:complete len:230 (+) Transcript_26410:253-942(+)